MKGTRLFYACLFILNSGLIWTNKGGFEKDQ